LIYNNANIDFEIVKIMNIDDKDSGNIDPGIAEIANFEPSDYAGINNYGAAEDYAEGNDGN